MNAGIGSKLESWTRLGRLSFPVPIHSKNLGYCLGGITLTGFLILFGTGIFMMQFFNPAPEAAHRSIRHIMQSVPAGGWIRSLHYWTAQAVILSMCAHLLRVFVTGAYKFPRILTWYFGVALFFTATMLSYFSGTVIKWDQEASEALEHYEFIVGMLGPLGSFMGGGLTESVSMNVRMFGFHVTLAPLVLIALIIGHFYLVHVFNISPLPRGPHSRLEEVPASEMSGTFTEHLWGIARFSLIFYGLVALLSLWVPAPLGEPPGPEPTGVKPPWIYLWQYGIENFMGMSGILYSTLILMILFLLVPWLDRGPSRDPRDRKGILTLGALTFAVMVGLTVYGGLSPEKVHHGHDHNGNSGDHAPAPVHDSMEGMDPATPAEPAAAPHEDDGHPH